MWPFTRSPALAHASASDPLVVFTDEESRRATPTASEAPSLDSRDISPFAPAAPPAAAVPEAFVCPSLLHRLLCGSLCCRCCVDKKNAPRLVAGVAVRGRGLRRLTKALGLVATVAVAYQIVSSVAAAANS